MSATIKVFQVGERHYRHVLDSMHDCVELRDEDNETLLVYGANDKVRNTAGRLGRFLVEFLDGRPRWVYYEMPNETRIVLGPDRHCAEVEVSKRYIGRSATHASSSGQSRSL